MSVHIPRDQPEKESEGEGERERERDLTRGEPDFQETSSISWSEKLVHPLLFIRAFYTFFVHRDQWIM